MKADSSVDFIDINDKDRLVLILIELILYLISISRKLHETYSLYSLITIN